MAAAGHRERARRDFGGNPDIETDKHPAVLAAQAARDKAAYDLAQTTVRAPADGIVSQASSFKVGQFVAAGTPLFSLVETGDTWVEANFKETQLTHLQPGQTADIDARHLSGTGLPRHGREHRRRHRRGILAAAGAERHRQLGQGHAAHPRSAEARHRRRRRYRCSTGMSANVTVDTGYVAGASAACSAQPWPRSRADCRRLSRAVRR